MKDIAQQGEVEGAWQEVHQRTIERDKISAERESIEYTASINLNSARKEVSWKPILKFKS